MYGMRMVSGQLEPGLPHSTSTSTLLDLMAEMNKKENITFLFSTHDQRVIDKARRVITIEDGKIISDEKR